MFEIRDVPEWGGRGIFARRDIPKGTVYWRFETPADAPEGSWESLGTDTAANFATTVEEIKKKAEADPDSVKDLLWGCYCHVPTRKVIVLRDGCQLTNHSFDPELVNGGGDWEEEICNEHAVSIKDIKAGDQLLEDYGVFQDFETPGMAELFKMYCQERYEFEKSIEIKHSVMLPE